MYGKMIGKFTKSALSPLSGAQKIMGGDIRGGIGDIAFGPDAYYGNYWKKQFGLREPQPEFQVPGGGEQVGFGDYSQGLGMSAQPVMSENPYAALRGRGY